MQNAVWFKEQWLETGRNGGGLYWKPRPTTECGNCGRRGRRNNEHTK